MRAADGGARLQTTLAEMQRSLERWERPTVETADDEFLDAMVAFEQRLEEFVPPRDRPRRDDSLASLINASPLPHHLKEQLNDLRVVRNLLVHIPDVHVGRSFARTALQRLRQAAVRLEGQPANAAALMTREILAVPPTETLGHVQTLLLKRGISQVAVREPERNRLLGWITQRSLLQALSQAPSGVDVSALPATSALADHGVVAVAPDTGLDHLVGLFEDPDVQTLAVMEGETLKGVVTRSDLLRLAY
jgi:CBS domain-containing protein